VVGTTTNYTITIANIKYGKIADKGVVGTANVGTIKDKRKRRKVFFGKMKDSVEDVVGGVLDGAVEKKF
jgi:hypothetical protein